MALNSKTTPLGTALFQRCEGNRVDLLAVHAKQLFAIAPPRNISSGGNTVSKTWEKEIEFHNEKLFALFLSKCFVKVAAQTRKHTLLKSPPSNVDGIIVLSNITDWKYLLLMVYHLVKLSSVNMWRPLSFSMHFWWVGGPKCFQKVISSNAFGNIVEKKRIKIDSI